MTTNVLNPTLYRALVARYGEKAVDIVSPGIEISWIVRRPAGATADARPERKVLNSGEEYRVRCPFCNDWKPRLFLNHRWGVYDVETGTRNLWMAQCFNEQCLADPNLQEQLYMTLYGGNFSRRPVKILPGRKVTDLELKTAKMPGPTVRLDLLAERHPNHHAIRYMQSRHLDPVKLGRLYGLGYCADSQYGYATDRIIIPITERGILYGWQARYIGDNVNGLSFKDANVPKYWTMPMTPKSVVGYCPELAVRHQTVVVVEGPADVWGFGPQAFGVLGKSINPMLVKKLNYWIGLYWGDETTVIVLLDPDQDAVALKKQKPHHIATAAEVLRQNLSTGLRHRVVPVYLPPHTDPGSLDRVLMRRIIRQRAEELRLPVSFSKDVRKPALDPKVLEFKTNYRGA